MQGAMFLPKRFCAECSPPIVTSANAGPVCICPMLNVTFNPTYFDRARGVCIAPAFAYSERQTHWINHGY